MVCEKMVIPQQLVSTHVYPIFREVHINVAYVILVLDGIDISLASGSFSFQHPPFALCEVKNHAWSVLVRTAVWNWMPQFGYVLSTDLRKNLQSTCLILF